MIEKMVYRGVVIACVLFREAFKKQHLDVLQLFLRRGDFIVMFLIGSCLDQHGDLEMMQ